MSILDGALRQFQWPHNNGTVTITFAYDKEITERAVAELEQHLDETKAVLASGVEFACDQAEEIARLKAELADVARERDAWKGTHDGLRRVYHDIGANLGADMPRELVNEVARRRMAQLADLQRQLADMTAERDRYMQIAMQAEAQRGAPEERKP